MAGALWARTGAAATRARAARGDARTGIRLGPRGDAPRRRGPAAHGRARGSPRLLRRPGRRLGASRALTAAGSGAGRLAARARRPAGRGLRDSAWLWAI